MLLELTAMRPRPAFILALFSALLMAPGSALAQQRMAQASPPVQQQATPSQGQAPQSGQAPTGPSSPSLAAQGLAPNPTGPAPVFNQRSLADTPGPLRGIERLGQPTQAEGGPTLVQPLGEGPRGLSPLAAVFGAALFTGQPASSSDAPNPNYVLAPGDRVSIRAWGAVDAEQTAAIDPSGNVFIPNVGPVRLAGTRVGDMQGVVAGAVQQVYTQQVQVYANVLQTQRIGVFVTGFVRNPGRYAGAASDSVLDFLLRAGGVDPTRGSFRVISVQRGGNSVARVDLYRFLLEGTLPRLTLQEGDTILVARQNPLVGADGAVRNNYLFEAATRSPISGRELIDLARPLPAATNAVVRGVRGSQPFSRYLTLRDLSGIVLQDQDTVTFTADVAARTVRVSVEGSRLFPSVLVTDRGMNLCQILDHIAVDAALANPRAVFLLRPSVAAQQRRSIDEALDRLERQLFLSPSPTEGVAAVRTAEAQFISSYIQRARRVQPEGRLVVFDSSGRCNPVRLEDGDIIVIPERSQTVMVQGEVNAPQAVVWRPDWTIAQYLSAAGGVSSRGRADTLMLRRPSGEVILEPTQPPQAGDELIALPYLDPKVFQIARDVFGAIFQVAVATRTFIRP
jgi:protein involved in polysaccharide export with SLBB domain